MGRCVVGSITQSGVSWSKKDDASGMAEGFAFEGLGGPGSDEDGGCLEEASWPFPCLGRLSVSRLSSDMVVSKNLIVRTRVLSLSPALEFIKLRLETSIRWRYIASPSAGTTSGALK